MLTTILDAESVQERMCPTTGPISYKHLTLKQFSALPIPLSKQDGYHMHPDKIAEEIARGKLEKKY